MKVSIITITYNSGKTLASALQSVADQTYGDIEHIIVDGASKDDTMSIVAQFAHVAQAITEPDRGIYDAMNKGVRLATGDVVGVLNSDDFLTSPTIIADIVHAFGPQTAAVIGDVGFVSPGNLDKVVRYYSSSNWSPAKFRLGFMPPHPSFYLRREYYEQYGLYQTDYDIAADYELLIRMLYTNELLYTYLPKQIVTMRTGGVSTKNAMSRYTLNQEIVRACQENGIYTNMLMLSLKYARKVFEYSVVKKHT